MTKTFSYLDPKTGRSYSAPLLTERDYHLACQEHDDKLGLVHHFVFVLEVTQMGFEGQCSIVVAECTICGKAIAFPVEVFYETGEPRPLF